MCGVTASPASSSTHINLQRLTHQTHSPPKNTELFSSSSSDSTFNNFWVSHTIIKQCSASSILLLYSLFYILYKKSLHYSHLFSQPHGNDLLTLMEVGEGHLRACLDLGWGPRPICPMWHANGSPRPPNGH